jgi:hypothetical protein
MREATVASLILYATRSGDYAPGVVVVLELGVVEVPGARPASSCASRSADSFASWVVSSFEPPGPWPTKAVPLSSAVSRSAGSPASCVASSLLLNVLPVEVPGVAELSSVAVADGEVVLGVALGVWAITAAVPTMAATTTAAATPIHTLLSFIMRWSPFLMVGKFGGEPRVGAIRT